MRITVLGCGASGGVPLIGGNWGECDPQEPRNRRRRSSILIEKDDTSILIDASPDCREQLIDAGVRRLDAVIFTHAHADHIHGIDDLRWVNVLMGATVPAFGDAQTLGEIGERFGYAFAPLDKASDGYYYKPCLEPNIIDRPFTIGPLTFQPYRQDHGFTETLGLRVGNFAYSVDVRRLDDAAFATLSGIETWVVGCLGRKPHPTHGHLDLVLDWIGKVAPQRAWLTHMSHALDYRTLESELPEGVVPAYDGLYIEV